MSDAAAFDVVGDHVLAVTWRTHDGFLAKHVKRLRFNDRVYIALIFQEFSEADEHRRKVDANWHYKSGIQHWRRMEKVFNDFENENRLILDAAGEGIYGVDAEGMTTFRQE